MAAIPQAFKEVLHKKAFAHLATCMSDGSPQVSPVWIDIEGDLLIVNTAKGRVKDRNMRRNPRVAVSITDPDNSYRAIMIRGRVVRITEESAEEHIDKMAKKYLGRDRYPYRASGEVRVLHYIEPVKVVTRE